MPNQPAKVPDIVIGAKQFPNPKGIKPVLDTDIRPVRPRELAGARRRVGPWFPNKEPLKMDMGNTPQTDVVPPEKGVRTFHKGTPYVDKTGPAILEKGEAVIPKDKNPMNPYAMITKGDKKPPKKIKEHSMKMSHDGKFIHTHVHHHPEHHPDETHVSSNPEEMAKHLTDNVAPNMSATPPAMEEAAPAAPAAAPAA